jgi:hypothetical protein
MFFCCFDLFSLQRYLQTTDTTLQQRVFIISGIAAGMLHLHMNNVLHGDLATRNVLLGDGFDAIVSDFGWFLFPHLISFCLLFFFVCFFFFFCFFFCVLGFAKVLEADLGGLDTDSKKTRGPIRWLAPEFFRPGQNTNTIKTGKIVGIKKF